MTERLHFVVLGLSITSSWGNGHATTYRGLVRELERRGHDVLFLERDVPYYAAHRDLPEPPFGHTALYSGLADLKRRFAADVKRADVVIQGSFVPDGVAVGEWVTKEAEGATAFYDIDTPITLEKLAKGDHEYLAPHLVPRFDLYLSFTGGPTLERLERELGSPAARPLYCSVDPEHYRPEEREPRWDLGYLGTYSADRQPKLEAALVEPARREKDGRFVVAGSMYPDDVGWPPNVERIDHLPPREHRRFYNEQRFTLNVTRDRMVEAGWSPSVRLFEAAACGTPVVTDGWPGLEEFFRIGTDIFVSESPGETLSILHDTSESERRRVGERARQRVLAAHTAAHRAAELESHARDALERTRAAPRAGVRAR